MSWTLQECYKRMIKELGRRKSTKSGKKLTWNMVSWETFKNRWKERNDPTFNDFKKPIFKIVILKMFVYLIGLPRYNFRNETLQLHNCLMENRK